MNATLSPSKQLSPIETPGPILTNEPISPIFYQILRVLYEYKHFSEHLIELSNELINSFSSK